MSNEELVALIQAGERDRLLELWGQVEKFIAQQARRRVRQLDGFGGVAEEDLQQAGFLAVVEAAETFDADAGYKFLTWLDFPLKTAFAEACGYRTKRQARDPLHMAVSLEAPVGEDEDGATLGDFQADETAQDAFLEAEEGIYTAQLHDALETALGTLPAEQADTLRRRFYRGQTLREISEEAGTKPEKVRKLEGAGLRALRQRKYRRELERFLDERTPYYSGTGLGAFQRIGSQPERLAIWREEQAGRFMAGRG